MDRQHIHEVAGHLVREAYLPAILSPPDKLRRVGKPTVNAVYLALQSFGGLFMLPPLPVYRLVQPPYLGVQAFVLLGKVIYLLLLPLDFRRADPRADTVEDGRTYLGGGVLQLLGSQLSFYRFQLRFGLFFGYTGFLGLLLLLGDNVVRPFQMLTSGLHFGRAAFHAERFGPYGLHFAHVLRQEFARLARVVVHPVPHDMGVVVRLP